MASGTLDVDRQNLDKPADTPKYWVTFTPYAGVERGCQRRVEIVGDEPLFEYLLRMQEPNVQLEWRTQRVREWMSEIRMTGHFLIVDFRFDEEEHKMFRTVSRKVVPFRRTIS